LGASGERKGGQSCTDQLESVVIFKDNKVFCEKKSDELGAGRSLDIDFIDLEFSDHS
jgi:hypothetical protein